MAGAALAVPAAEARPSPLLFPSETDLFGSASRLQGGALQRTYLNLYDKAERRGAKPGRNILLQGVMEGHGHVRAPSETDLRRSIRVLRRAGTPAISAATSARLAAIAACESGGNPTSIGGGGLYRGKYQFSYGTWQSVGGSGDPAAAPEAEQDRRAAALLARDGTGQWPVCGA